MRNKREGTIREHPFAEEDALTCETADRSAFFNEFWRGGLMTTIVNERRRYLYMAASPTLFEVNYMGFRHYLFKIGSSDWLPTRRNYLNGEIDGKGADPAIAFLHRTDWDFVHELFFPDGNAEQVEHELHRLIKLLSPEQVRKADYRQWTELKQSGHTEIYVINAELAEDPEKLMSLSKGVSEELRRLFAILSWRILNHLRNTRSAFVHG